MSGSKYALRRRDSQRIAEAERIGIGIGIGTRPQDVW